MSLSDKRRVVDKNFVLYVEEDVKETVKRIIERVDLLNEWDDSDAVTRIIKEEMGEKLLESEGK